MDGRSINGRMDARLVMTVIGQDRPGLVDSLAGTITTHKANWLESRMSHLGGQFAGILTVSVPAEHEGALRRALEGLDRVGLAVVVQADPEATAESSRTSLQMEMVGQDRPGIVRALSHALATFGVNVEELTTECESAPMSGETLFRARAKLHIPTSTDTKALRDELERIATDLMVDLKLAEAAAD